MLGHKFYKQWNLFLLVRKCSETVELQADDERAMGHNSSGGGGVGLLP